MQYLVVYAVCLRLNCFNSIIVLPKEERRSQKVDDLPVLATCRSGTLVMLSSEVNGHAAHRSTQ